MDVAVIYDPVTLATHAVIVTTDGPQALLAHSPPAGMVRVAVDAMAYLGRDAKALAANLPIAVANVVADISANDAALAPPDPAAQPIGNVSQPIGDAAAGA